MVGLIVVNIWNWEDVTEEAKVEATDFVTDCWSESKLSRIVFTIIDESVVVVGVGVVVVLVTLRLFLDRDDGFLLMLFE